MTDSIRIEPSATFPARNFWQRRISDPIVAQLTQGLTPKKIALTIALGSAISLFPILGTTTLICVFLGVYLKLNQPILQAVNLACTPIHLPFIFLALKGGERLFGIEPSALDLDVMRQLLVAAPWRFLQDYSVAGFHAIGFWALVIPLWFVAVYFVSYPFLLSVDRARISAAARNAAERAKEHPIP